MKTLTPLGYWVRGFLVSSMCALAVMLVAVHSASAPFFATAALSLLIGQCINLRAAVRSHRYERIRSEDQLDILENLLRENARLNQRRPLGVQWTPSPPADRRPS